RQPPRHKDDAKPPKAPNVSDSLTSISCSTLCDLLAPSRLRGYPPKFASIRVIRGPLSSRSRNARHGDAAEFGQRCDDAVLFFDRHLAVDRQADNFFGRLLTHWQIVAAIPQLREALLQV